MNTGVSQEVSKDTYLALDKLSKLGVTNIVVVDDSAENTAASEVLRNAVQREGLQLDVVGSVEEFRQRLGSLEAKGHTLVLTDYNMPCDRVFLKRPNAGGIAVVDICIEHEVPGRLNFPIVISHIGQGHTGQMVDICYGTGNIRISDFERGKADPKFWEMAIIKISEFLTEEGQAKTLWNVRHNINSSQPYFPSALREDSFKIGFITLELLHGLDLSITRMS